MWMRGRIGEIERRTKLFTEEETTLVNPAADEKFLSQRHAILLHATDIARLRVPSRHSRKQLLYSCKLC
jgi:hypothetical protein